MRVSVTTLDAFYRYINGDEYISYEDIINRILRKDVSSRAMEIGSAFHGALEILPDETESIERLEKDGITFSFADDIEYIIQPKIREVKTEYELNGFTIVGVADAIYGDTVIDHKTTSRLDLDRYHDSLQWRFYLQMFNANRFMYQIFQIEVDKEDENKYTVNSIDRISFYRYPEMEAENERLITEFSYFVKQIGIEQ